MQARLHRLEARFKGVERQRRRGGVLRQTGTQNVGVGPDGQAVEAANQRVGVERLDRRARCGIGLGIGLGIGDRLVLRFLARRRLFIIAPIRRPPRAGDKASDKASDKAGGEAGGERRRRQGR